MSETEEIPEWIGEVAARILDSRMGRWWGRGQFAHLISVVRGPRPSQEESAALGRAFGTFGLRGRIVYVPRCAGRRGKVNGWDVFLVRRPSRRTRKPGPQYKGKRNHRAAQGTSQISNAQWDGILKRFNYQCAYCGAREKIGLEHVTPVSRGGHDGESNIVPGCMSCNSSKGNRTPLEWFAGLSARQVRCG